MSEPVTAAAIAATIDHAILKPELTRAEVDADLELAARYGIFSVCVRPSDVAHAVRVLAGSGVAVGTVIGFPHGTTTTATKVAEAHQSLADGAVELDMVVNIGRLRSGLLDDVEADVRAVVEAAGDHVVKVILETALLSDEQVVAGSEAAERAGAAFVKTSTGFAGGGATVPHLRLMRGAVGDTVQIKASGGVRDLDTLLEMRAIGVTRFGTSATATILDDAAVRESGGTGTGASDSSSY
ncbi:deoxyribose-phosphate aldolase [Aeromicrobium marinum DSM 15272]|uniref:Deoxyribose-phosphate aldolase n=1 Tax=Aeromicrobium marinum DSM 15272 TaxID=585531 RepID=E2SBP6_9ACTN|nr:deoxyribose-phosphate aldolase [Aeromicrobium marinum]EFQ83792.1 deoxyribose-phosphate aldolase [Aeromicrobium marinum DSM 15272]